MRSLRQLSIAHVSQFGQGGDEVGELMRIILTGMGRVEVFGEYSGAILSAKDEDGLNRK